MQPASRQQFNSVAQALVRDFAIDHGRLQVAMAEQLLNDFRIHGILGKMCREEARPL